MAARDLQFKQAFKGTGSSASLLSNRLSWYYDLKGPSITLDTGCSSSLNAFHLACQSLRNNESDMVRATCALSYPSDTKLTRQ